MTRAAADAYHRRFREVLAHIDAHLEEDLSVERLSGVAAFSRFHFHRQFSSLFGIGVHRYVQLVRLRRASYELAFQRDTRILEIALACGYDSHEAFSRAFKKIVGQTPSEFRDRPGWVAWHETYRRLTELRSEHMKTDHRADDVRIERFPATRVAVLEHRGDPRSIGDSVRAFIAWRQQHGLPPRASRTFNVLHDNPAETPPEDYRLDLCAAIERGVAPNAAGVVERTMPGGPCAVLRHVGTDDTLGAAVSYLYATWLATSGREPRDVPLFLERVRFAPEVPGHEAVTDVYLPLEELP